MLFSTPLIAALAGKCYSFIDNPALSPNHINNFPLDYHLYKQNMEYSKSHIHHQLVLLSHIR